MVNPKPTTTLPTAPTTTSTSNLSDEVGKKAEAENRMKENLARFLRQQQQQQQQQQRQVQQQKQHQQQQHQQQRQSFFLPPGSSRTRLRLGTVSGKSVTYKLYDPKDSFLDRAVDLINPDLRPVPPQPSCPRSMQIYKTHKLMAGDLVQVQSELSELRRQKNELEEKLKVFDKNVEQREKDLKDQVLKLQAEKDSLSKFHRQLTEELHLIKAPIFTSMLG